jgi:putative transposase
MPEFRRYYIPGATYFFTLVTAERFPFFRDVAACRLLGNCMRLVRRGYPFRVNAIVLLPDHLHAIWTLPAGDCDFSSRWRAIQARFTQEWLANGRTERAVPAGQFRQRRRGIWQARFLEHAIRDEDDLIHHANYVHYNPVKHGLAESPRDWPWSTFHRYVQAGDYDAGWGRTRMTFPSVRAELLE